MANNKHPRSAYFPHKRVTSDPVGESRTKQSFKAETDINNILRQSDKGLLVTHLNAHEGSYGDFINAPDYHTALNRIHAADTAFMEIPAQIRARFNNDPAQFLDFVQEPDNLEEMREMGLAPAKRQQTPILTEPTSPGQEDADPAPDPAPAPA